ncbi:wax ester synthase/diacylglycerol acyltransferase 6-like [Apium graveolens]|uniref:wax ester synthase/diacylglycerol acyltransferase 6-like n=1 Tax=Apium graveolens TaxID=4045 RepID=UPI003D7A875E
MALYEEETFAPVSPNGQCLTTSAFTLTVVVVFEFQVPIHDLPTISMLETLFVPINRRFSSLLVGEKNGEKKWKKVEVNVKEHVKVPTIPTGKSPEYYEKYLVEYLLNISSEPLPEHRPLWELHVFPCPTIRAAGNLIFKFHHALGDGYSIMAAILSMVKRADDPSLSVTFPSWNSSCTSSKSESSHDVKSVLKRVPLVSSWILNTVRDFGWSVLKSSVLADDLSPIRSGEVGLEFLPMDISTMEFSLDHIKQIKTSLKVTVNDVITGVIHLGTRLYMKCKDKNAGDKKATTVVLLNTRRNMEASNKSSSEMIKPNVTIPWGNHFAFLQIPLPKLSNTSPGYDPSPNFDPLQFVYESHHVIKRKRNNPAAFLTGGLLDYIRKIKGPETPARYIYKTMSNSSMGISSLIGPADQMSLCEHPISGIYFSVAGVPQSLRVSVLSYMSKVRISFAVDKNFIDLEKLKTCVQNAFESISKAALHS